MSDFSDELPEGWCEVSLIDICRPKQWPTISTADLTPSGFPVYGANGKIGFYPKYTHENATILITCRGATCGTINICKPKSWVNGNAMALDELQTDAVDFNYVLFGLKNRGFSDVISGSAQPQITRAGLEPVTFPLAPLPEQRRIVAKIEALQARSLKAREALEAIPPLLKQFRQSVLAAAFRGDLTADWRKQHPDVEPASVLLDRIRTERRRKWEEAELAKFKAKGKVPKNDSWKEKYVEPEPVDETNLPELPERWCWATWNLLSEWITYGFTRPMPHVEEGVPIITAKNVVDGEVRFEDTHFTPAEAFRALSNKDRPEAGDILITKDGTIGRAAVVPKGKVFCINQSVAVVYLRSCPIDRRYLLRLIEAPMTQEPIQDKARGMALQHLSITDFGRMAVPLPPIAEQSEIVKCLEGKLERLERVKSEIVETSSSLAQLDRSILAKAFRGELVPQDPNDEPASVLLERIGAERAADTRSKSRGRRKRSNV